ncbi:MBL fold metallo-hydrolase [Streptomyces sp. NPDC088789]|uniref:MBL fold metallo-hydrolase n=1 Tax=Streptomyces sp. NPDC088789 TaxID=3365899 RepID=UPI003820704B
MAITVDVGGHATLLIEANGFRLLCDPLLGDAYRSGLLGFAPARRITVPRLPRPDAVWISHSHRDHFDPASLHALDRGVPVLHPADPRITHVLDRLGFTRTTVVHDWFELAPRPGLRLTWTPSTFQGPEHGLAVRSGGTFVWHLVDSLVRPEWVDRLVASAGPPDLLLTPCQPILETRSVDGVPLGPDPDWADAPAALLARARPRHVVPLPEGQYALGAASWLNRHKFPVPPEAVDRLIRADDPGRGVLRPDPGDRIEVRPDGSVRVEARAAEWVRATGDPRDRSHAPGEWIEGLAARHPADGSAEHDGLDRLLGPPGVGFGGLPSAADRLRPTSYRLVLVGAGGRAVAERFVRVGADGALVRTPPGARPDVELAVCADDLDELLAARLGYSAAQYGGRLRELRPGLDAEGEPGLTVITSRHDPVPAEGRVVLSGIGLFALLLRARLGSPLAELDTEVDALLDAGRDRTGAHPHLPARPAGMPSEPLRAAGVTPVAEAVWRRIAARLAAAEDPATASGTLRHEGGTVYVGVLGRADWPEPAPGTPETGVLVLTCLTEAQPQLGGGVRFPGESYRALLANLRRSPVRDWQVLWTLPAGVSVPRWRAASLFPIAPERLLTDLRHQGWNGRLTAPPTPWAGAEREWWLGVPRRTTPPWAARTLRLEAAPDRPLSGTVVDTGGAEADAAEPGGPEPGGPEPGGPEADGPEADGPEPGGPEPGGPEADGTEADGTEADGAESGGAEPDGTGSSGAEPDGTGSSGAEPDGAGSSGVEPDGAESSGTEADGAESGGAEPDGTGSSGAEPDGAGSSGVEPDGAGSSGAEPDGAGSSGAEPDGAESGGVEPDGAGSSGTEADGAESGGAEPDGAGSSGVERGAAEPNAAKQNSAEPNAPKPSSAEPNAAKPSGADAGEGEAGAVSVAFRLLPAPGDPLCALLTGETRFSWLLPPRETVRLCQGLSPAAFAEHVFLLACAQSAPGEAPLSREPRRPGV